MIRWSVDPEFLNLGPLHLRWYGILFVTGFALGYRIFRAACAREGKDLRQAEALLTYLFLGVVIGARLGHCFFYEPEYFLAHPWEVIAVWQGGLASHGAGIGGMLAVYLFTRRYPSFGFAWTLDRLSPAIAFCGALIRLGNLMNSEIIGRPTTLPWAFVFTRIDQVPRHPAQIYESLGYFLTAALGWGIYRRYRNNPPTGLLFGVTLLAIFLVRFLVEFVKENQESFENGMWLNMGQLLSIPFLIAGALLVGAALRRGSPALEGTQRGR